MLRHDRARTTHLASATFAAALIGSAMLAPPPAGAETVLRYADHNTGASPRGEAVKRWFELIEEKSGGDLRVEAYFGGTLGKSNEALQLVESGTADMALIIPDYFPGDFVANNIYKLHPIGPKRWEDIYWVYRELFERMPAFSRELEARNQKVLLFATGLPVTLASTYEVQTIEDLKGKKWRASSRWHQSFFEWHGAVPTSVPWSETYQALQTGLLDGNLADYDGTHMAKLDEVAKHQYVSRAAWWGSPFMHTINLDTWNSLSEKHRKILSSTAEHVMKNVFGELFAQGFDDVRETQEGMGVTVRLWTEEFKNNWADPEMLKEYHAQWVSEAQEAGLENAQEVMDQTREVIQAAIEREGEN